MYAGGSFIFFTVFLLRLRSLSLNLLSCQQYIWVCGWASASRTCSVSTHRHSQFYSAYIYNFYHHHHHHHLRVHVMFVCVRVSVCLCVVVQWRRPAARKAAREYTREPPSRVPLPPSAGAFKCMYLCVCVFCHHSVTSASSHPFLFSYAYLNGFKCDS